MKIINSQNIPDFCGQFASPKGKYATESANYTVALGYNYLDKAAPKAPFDVARESIPPGKANYPFHSHSAQFEYYQILSGTGKLRHDDGETAIGPGDAFMCEPGQAHQLINDGSEHLVYLIVADHPLGESCYYPDSKKWLVRSPRHHIVRGPDNIDYFDGEE